MLSIHGIQSSAAAVAYYEKDDYYAHGEGDAGEPGEGAWYGKGADSLGLAGHVDREIFRDILDGRLPDGTQLGRKIGDEIEHRPGYDLTFSAPKSVSIAAEVGGDERLLDAHETAVKTALDWIETNAAVTRQRGLLGLREVNTGNLVIALFQHDTSREQDPQLHTHAVVANATEREDGRWVSIESKAIYHLKMAGGNVYRAALAEEVQRLGYEINQVNADGRFELKGIDDSLIQEFSQRRQQIVAALKERGLSGPEASAEAALLTRANKVNHDRAELEADWSERAGDRLGSVMETVVLARSGRDQRVRGLHDARHAVGSASDRLSETEAVFTRAELIQWSLAAGMGRIGIDEIEGQIAVDTAAGKLEKSSLGRRAAYTTPRARDLERRVIEAVREGRGDVAPMVDANEVRLAIERSTLTEGQQKALDMIATSSDRFVGVVGRPGTGKSYLMGRTRELLEANGRVLVGAAQNAEAARKLELESGIKSTTLHTAWRQAARDQKRLRRAGSIEGAKILANYEKQVWVIDEATQVDAAMMRKLATAAEKLHFRVVLVGDPQQLGAIGAGKPFELMLRDADMRHVEMDQIQRQRDPEHLKAVRSAIAGDVTQAITALAPDTAEIANKDQRLGAILEAWKKLGAARSEALMITAGNADKARLNAGARDILRIEGKLAGESAVAQLGRVFSSAADRSDVRSYKVGDLVRFGWSLKGKGIGRGEYLRVTGIDRAHGVLLLARQDAGEGSEPVRWNPSNVGSGSRQGVEIFRPQQNTLAIGETIRWTRNNRQLGLANGQSLTVEAIDGQRVTVRSSDGKALTVDTGKLEGRHWEHAYASTVYSSQGGTVKHALVNAEAVQRGLFSQKAFLVAISRHKESIRLFTDNTAAVAENVARHSGEKTSVTGSLREAAAYQFGDRWKATIAAIDEVMRGKPPRGRERLRELDHSSGGGKHRDRDFDR